jgi:carboxymethylenebutenolidase
MDQKIINLYDRFTHGGMNRREFLDRLAELAGSAAAAVALLPLLQNDYARAAIVPADDGRLAVERVSYDSPKGKINGYLVRARALGQAAGRGRHP